ncbi:MAG: hypothetical protein N2557_07990 [Hydrogenophilus sp.]|nr:hypothetical protein [Hydrogenophilus sp.]
MEKIKLSREGKRPLVFAGELVFEDRTRTGLGRWHKIRVYRTKGGQYVVYLLRETIWEGERDTREVEVLDTPKAVVSWVERNSPEFAEDLAEDLGVEEGVD